MAFLTRGTVNKGTPATMTLEKASLSSFSLVAQNPDFSNHSKWSKVFFLFAGEGGQNKRVEFDATKAEPTGIFHATFRARGTTFQIERIIIQDHDNGKLILKRDQLSSELSTLDIVFGESPAWLATAVDWNVPDGHTVQENGGLTNGGAMDQWATSTSMQTADSFCYDFTFDSTTVPDYFAVGVSTALDGASFVGVMKDPVEGFGVQWYGTNQVNIQLPAGQNTIRVERIGNKYIDIYINGAKVNVVLGFISVRMPSVRTMGGVLQSAMIPADA